MRKTKQPTARVRGEKQRETLYRLQAEICRVLGHPRRLAILDLLADGEKSNAELLRALRASKANLSQHLAVMKQAGLVRARRNGRETSYSLTFPEIKDACRLTRDVLSQRLLESTRLARALGSGAAERAGRRNNL